MTPINVPNQVREVINRLYAHSFKAYITGKCVRELLTVKYTIDFDVVTDAPIDRICRIFEKYNINTDNIENGEVIVQVVGMAILVSPYRKGFTKDGRVIYADNIYEDLSGRDFSFNAIAYNEREGFIDPFLGLECLKKSELTVSAIGEGDFSPWGEGFAQPESSISRDPVNILTALGYYASGDYSIEPKTKEGIFNNLHRIPEISIDRIRTELSWVIRGKRVTAVLEEYREVFTTLIPELKMLEGAEHFRKEHSYDMFVHTIKSVGYASPILTLRYALFFHSLGMPDCFSIDVQGVGHYYGHAQRSKIYAERIMTRLGFTKSDIREVCFLIEHHDDELGSDRRSLKLQLQKMQDDKLIKLLQFKYADLRAKSPEFEGAAMKYKRLVDSVNEILAMKECYLIQNLAINKYDLIQYRFAHNEEEAEKLLEALLDLVIEVPIYNSRNRLLDFAEKLVRSKTK